MSSLGDILEEALVSTPHTFIGDFIPIDALESAVTTTRINAETQWRDKLLSPGLVDRIHKNARRVFAILCIIGESRRIKSLLKEGLTDDELPLAHEKEPSKKSVTIVSARAKELHSFATWPRPRIELLLAKQWLVLAPILDGRWSSMVLDHRTPLPIRVVKEVETDDFDFFYHVAFHQAHYRGETKTSYETQACLYRYDRNSESGTAMSRNLSDILALELEHRHVVRPLGSLLKGEERYIFFPWPDCGSLKEFWITNNSAPRSSEMLLWALRQMAGLANGLEALHGARLPHNHVKATNILLFGQPQKFDDATTYLAIGGFPSEGRYRKDLETLHSYATYARPTSTSTCLDDSDLLPQDEPLPDLSKPPVSRYPPDVRAMGLVFLHFTLWLLHGMGTVKQFASRCQVPGRVRRPEILPLLLEDIKTGPGFRNGTVWQRILEFLTERVLVDATSRCTAGGLCSGIRDIVETVEKNLESYQDESLRQAGLKDMGLGQIGGAEPLLALPFKEPGAYQSRSNPGIPGQFLLPPVSRFFPPSTRTNTGWARAPDGDYTDTCVQTELA